MLYVTRLTQNQNESVNSILQYGRVVRKDCCVVFSASGFQYLILYHRQCKGKVATTYLKRLRATKIFQYKNLLLLKPPQITRIVIHYCNHWEKRKTIIFYHIYQEHFHIWWDIFVNDGDIKGITHNFWWEYFMYFFWN